VNNSHAGLLLVELRPVRRAGDCSWECRGDAESDENAGCRRRAWKRIQYPRGGPRADWDLHGERMHGMTDGHAVQDVAKVLVRQRRVDDTPDPFD
jgi:hypothetical protein